MYENWDDYTPVEYNINHLKNGIELKYLHKPSQSTINRLKRNGWMWSSNSGVWYKKNTTEAQSFAVKECSLTQKRKKMIANMPKFYKSNCGYTEDTLLCITKNSFDKIYKVGTLKSIAQELVLEILSLDALALLREIYLMIINDEEYRKEFIKKIPRELYRTDENGRSFLVDNQKHKQNPNQGDIEHISKELTMKQSCFWQSLELFGQLIRPVNRIAYDVSNYRNSYSNIISTYYKPKNRQEYYLYSILNDLTLSYDDLLVRTIKIELKKEKDYILNNITTDQIDYYLLSIYSFLSDSIEETKKLISTYVDIKSPKNVIQNVNRRKNSPHKKENIKKIVFKERCAELGYNNETTIFAKGSAITIEERKVVGITEDVYKYNLLYEKWIEFMDAFLRYDFLNMGQKEFSALYNEEWIEDDTSYCLDIFLANDTIIHYDGSTHDKGVKLFLELLHKYTFRPDNAEHITIKRNLHEEVW